MGPIYLDYNATTPVDPEVLKAMLPYLQEVFGNPSSTTHSFGWEARQAVEKARNQAAVLLNTKAKNIVWTSGATESINMALLGTLRRYLRAKEKTHLITTQIEHKATLDVSRALEREGAEVTFLKPDSKGLVSSEAVKDAIKPHTRMISVIMGQNEIGTINPVKEIGILAKQKQIFYHIDAAQCIGKTPIDVNVIPCDFISASGHKIYGPKGVGFLYVNNENMKIELEPLFYGGSQEHGLRPGTLNVASIVGMGLACEIGLKNMEEESARLIEMRDTFIKKLLDNTDCVRLNGHPEKRLCSNISLTLSGLDSDVFSLGLSGIAVSSGSACSAGAPSHVLAAIGHSIEEAQATLRIGIGRFTTKSHLDFAAEKILAMIKKYKR